MARSERNPQCLFAPSRMEREQRTDGSIILRSPQPLGSYARCTGDWLVYWAGKSPQQPFLLERRSDGRWAGVTYGEALESVRHIAGWLLARRLPSDRPLCILSDNSVEHALLALAAMHVGIPVAPVSPAYSLVSTDFGKLKTIVQLIQPSAIFVDDGVKFAPALDAIRSLHDAVLVVGTATPGTSGGALAFSDLASGSATVAVNSAFATVSGDTIAKILFTSGSTGEPKGVINTQRMLCANQQAIRQVWPFVIDTPPVIVDWLPWNHTFGGNFTFNLVLCNGGTLYIDDGRPAPGLFDKTVANLQQIAPTIQFNVPRGYHMLVNELRSRPALRANFFSRLQLIFYAAASLPPNLWDALIELAETSLGERVALVSAWGSTETGPLAAACHYQAERAGVIGVAVPGCDLKLVPSGDKQEIRVRGPNVTPGYWRRAALSAAAFDEEGFYLIGDAMRLVDAANPDLGLIFDGRIAEDFKLSSGTWVNVGALRLKALAALAPLAQDIVLAGHDRDEVCLLIFPNLAACRSLCGAAAADATLEQVLEHPLVRAHIAAGLSELRRDGTGSSTYAARAVLLTEPPSIDHGEINDKGCINQGAVLTRRRELVDALYALTGGPHILTPSPVRG